jgi:hypothetical protein
VAPGSGQPRKRARLPPGGPVASAVFRRRVFPACDGFHVHAWEADELAGVNFPPPWGEA